MSILLTSDFTDEFKVSTGLYSDLDAYLPKYEEKYLTRLMGKAMYDLYIADLDASTPQVPQTQKYIDIHNAFNDQATTGCLLESEGFRAMIKMFVYFHYVRDQQYQISIGGAKRPVHENAATLGYQGYNLVEAYNRAASTYNDVQSYIHNNLDTYTEYDGVQIEYMTGI